MSAPQESTPTVAENDGALPTVTFAEFYSWDHRDMLRFVSILASYAGSGLAWEIPLVQPAQPTTAAATQAFLLVGHFNREIDDHLSQPPRVFSPLAALGLSFTKAIFSPMKKRLKVTEYFQLGMAVAARGGGPKRGPLQPRLARAESPLRDAHHLHDPRTPQAPAGS